MEILGSTFLIEKDFNRTRSRYSAGTPLSLDAATPGSEMERRGLKSVCRESAVHAGTVV